MADLAKKNLATLKETPDYSRIMNTRFVHAVKRSLFSGSFVRSSEFTNAHEGSTKKGSFYRVDEPGIHDPWFDLASWPSSI